MDRQTMKQVPTCACGARTMPAQLPVETLDQPSIGATSDRALEPMLTIDEVCAILRTSKSTIYSMRSEGRGPIGVKVGRRVLFRPVDLERFLEQNARGPER